jgi:hypothetical protein
MDMCVYVVVMMPLPLPLPYPGRFEVRQAISLANISEAAETSVSDSGLTDSIMYAKDMDIDESLFEDFCKLQHRTTHISRTRSRSTSNTHTPHITCGCIYIHITPNYST